MLQCAQLILLADPCPVTLHGEKLRADILRFSPDPGTVEGALGFGVKRHSLSPPPVIASENSLSLDFFSSNGVRTRSMETYQKGLWGGIITADHSYVGFPVLPPTSVPVSYLCLHCSTSKRG